MTSEVARRMILGVALFAGLAGCGGRERQPHSGTTLTAYARTVAANDSFAGHIVHASGPLAGYDNSVQVRLYTDGGSGNRKLTVAISSSPCRGKRRCVLLGGTLRGTLIQRPGLADIGRTFEISLSGTVTPLASVSGKGTVGGTGNVRFGHELLRLTLSGRTGRIEVAAHSAQVPGFTSP